MRSKEEIEDRYYTLLERAEDTFMGDEEIQELHTLAWVLEE